MFGEDAMKKYGECPEALRTGAVPGPSVAQGWKGTPK